jgi:hypothetical protein
MFLVASATLICVSGCGKSDEIKVYRVVKAPLEDSSSPADDSNMSDTPPAMAPTSSPASSAPQAASSQVAGETPSGWQPQQLSSMRQASFLVKGNKGTEADISLVMLGGAAGGSLENVNRWLSQLGQPAISEEQLKRTAQHVSSPVGDVTVVDLKGLPGGGDPAKDGRIIAGFATNANNTFFFKMRGNADLAESQKGNFIKWIHSVNVTAGASPVSSPSSDMPPGHPVVSSSAVEPGTKKLQWKVPNNWKTAPVTSMRYASFSVPGQNGEAADVSVVDLPGEAGSDLDNVNRWRGQIGLPPVEDSGLQSLIAGLKGTNDEFRTVDMAGPKARTLAAWVRQDGHTWFFKLSGPNQLVEGEKGKFAEFLQSVQFHP